MIVQRSPELQQASRLNEAPPPVALPPEPAKEPLAAPSETPLGFRPEDAVRHKGRSVPESRADARDTGVGARSREQAQGPAKARKEAATSEMSGGTPATAPSTPAPARQPHLSASEQAVATQATPERSAALGLSRASSGLQARLTGADRAAAESTVRDLVTRANGRVVAEPGPVSQADAGATILTVLVPADRWDELRRGLEAVGKLRVTGQKVEDAGQLLITLRLEH